ncbi:MAG: asparagine synthase (glutamine-hydrolyzing) [Acidobacteriota bacterium]|nr:MAG: asparagine synthase (glutamine-hydrolyzing) [Acidobacteriota bacterium]
MCGIAGIIGNGWSHAELEAMVSSQRHRGPDATGTGMYGLVGFGHNRLSIIDLSPAGRQPMSGGRLHLVFNGEIYNYRELRAELDDYPYASHTDSEVILAAYEKWGSDCLDRFIGMFAFLLWDERERVLLAARDRFGVKPLYYAIRPDGSLRLSSEIKALHAGGVPAVRDETTWATWLATGLYDHSDRTFWRGIRQLPPGHRLIWRAGDAKIERWYDLAERAGPEYDQRPVEEVEDEYLGLLEESVSLRFRSDVPVGINLSGGLDSSILLGLVHQVQGPGSDVKALTFATGDPNYDELPWVGEMLAGTNHPSLVSLLRPEEVPALAESVQQAEDEPFGGLPTLAYAKLFEMARANGLIVLLDGQGLDEQWAGYDYYASGDATALIQGTLEKAVRDECLTPEFRALAEPFMVPRVFPDGLRNLQYRDARYTKIPRALRFNDRVSMRSSTELREPFLDHRLFELALRQPAERKIAGGTHKWLLRRIAARICPAGIVEAPKRPLQTPQREWLRGPLRDWANDRIEAALEGPCRDWFRPETVRSEWARFQAGESDNSFYLWQWISAGLSEFSSNSSTSTV